MGTAYRASHRTKPIMDAFSYHPYMERSDLPPTFRHNPLANTRDDRRLREARSRCSSARSAGRSRRGRRCRSSTTSSAWRRKIPRGAAPICTAGASRRPRIPVSEATQARYYADGFHLAACQPTVRTLMVFRLIDSRAPAELPVGRLLRRPADAEVEPRRGRRRRQALPGRGRSPAAPRSSRPSRSSTGSAACSPATPTAPTRRSSVASARRGRWRRMRGKGDRVGTHAPRDREAEVRPLPDRRCA